MQTAIRQHLEATITGTGVPAALRALHNLYGMSGTEIAFALSRDRTMVSLYLNGRQDMPEKVRARLRDVLSDCMAVARSIPTNHADEDELLAAIVSRTQAILATL